MVDSRIVNPPAEAIFVEGTVSPSCFSFSSIDDDAFGGPYPFNISISTNSTIPISPSNGFSDGVVIDNDGKIIATDYNKFINEYNNYLFCCKSNIQGV